MATAVSVEGSTFTLLIDNYDSYTFNLFQYLAEVNGRPPCVIRNDQLTWEALQAVLPHFHNVVISPGPGVPSNSADFGVCEQLLREAELPVLGVCLGHQGLAHVSGAERAIVQVVRAPRVAHGVVSQVQHTNDPLFQGVPLSFKVVRYHSWTVSDAPAFGQHLECIARSVDDGLVMAIRHKARPMWGVQFHPESVCTEHGKTILRNFRDLSRRHRAHVPAAGLLQAVRGQPKVLLVGFLSHRFPGVQREVTTWKRRGGQVQQRAYRLAADQSFFDVVDRKLAKRKCPIDKDLPFDFVGGFVGYFGYEMKHEAGAFPDLPSTAQADAPDAAFVFADRVVAFDHVARSVYVMCLGKEARGTGEEGGAEERASREWFAQVEQSLASDPSAATSPRHTSPSVQDNAEQQPPVPFALQRPYEQYKDDIRACLEEIGRGDSYELCLTNKITTPLRPDPLGLYLRLRESNPAPFASFLRLEEDLHILSSSPEKFLSVDNARTVECKPIKGTTPRGRTPEEDEALKAHLQSNPKDFSENLMIVDLIRNDMGRVCEINSVHVPYLMHVESYATGSMTGAPKLRSMDILNRLEKAPRGVYSGVLGYLSAAGSASFNVVIRTAVIGPQAVVADSDVEGEFDEMLLKAHRLITTICDAAGHRKDGLAIAGVPPEKLLSPPPAPAPEPPFSGAAAFLRSLSPRGMDLGVGRIRSFLASLGEPQNQ
ncbi:glutamine amidotransferase, putative, partial [Acanthamoeba castellanii str. Neff]